MQEGVDGVVNGLRLRPFRPDTSAIRAEDATAVVDLMSAAWHPDPESRPDFKTGVRVKLKPLLQGQP